MRVLILADRPGWIVDRCVNALIDGLPDIEFIKSYYVGVQPTVLRETSVEFDLVHYGNWGDLDRLAAALPLPVPSILSVRSYRFPEAFRAYFTKFTRVHCPCPELAAELGGVYIPDGIDNRFFEPLRVGYAGVDDAYKGVDLIRQAVDRAAKITGLPVTFAPALGDVAPADMPAYFRAIDVYVCASIAEGYGAPVMEALASGVPIISTRVGIAWQDEALRDEVQWVERSPEAIAEQLVPMVRWKHGRLRAFRWSTVCDEFRKLYQHTATWDVR